MWLELPVNVDLSGLDAASLEPLFYRVVLLLFSFLTNLVDSGSSETSAENITDDMLTNAAKHLLQTILIVRFISKY